MASGSSGENDERKKSTNDGLRSGFLGKTGTDEAPLDKHYYNALNVSPTASGSEIKRAYYALSLQYHPDRTQTLDDFTRREYAERFKLISQAYAILSDPEKRALYNRYGRDERILANGSPGVSLEEFDPDEFFRMMFGGEEFKDIVGHFELAKSFKHAISDLLGDAQRRETELTAEEQEEKARKRLESAEERRQAREQRLEQLSNHLIARLSLFTTAASTNNDETHQRQSLNDFSEVIRTDMVQLLGAPHGEHLLHSIGYIYSSKARLWLSKMDSQEGHIGKRLLGFGKHFHSTWRERAHVVKETVKTIKSAIQWGQSMSKLAQASNEDEENDDTQSQVPFPHHSGHLEYSGQTPPESVTPKTSPPTESKVQRKSSAQPVVPLTEEQRRQLEADTTAKSMQALWRAVKLEIESVEREVCDRVLHDRSCSREVMRHRCVALGKMGELWQQARDPASETS